MTAAIDIAEFLGVQDERSPTARISLLRSRLPYQSLERIQEALDGMRPFEIFDTDMGAQMVDDLLTRIEFGVFS